MEHHPLDELPLSVIVKTEPDCFEHEREDCESYDLADVKVEEGVVVKIEEVPQLIVTDAFPPFIPSNASDSPVLRSQFSPPSIDYRKGKLYEISAEDNCDDELESLLGEFELIPKKDKGKQHVCPVCNFEANTRPSLIRHKIAVHGEQKYACKVCGFRTGYLGNLLKHEKNHHGQLMQCKKCELKTKHACPLEKHALLHSDKRFSCDQCNFRTTNGKYLEQHKFKHKDKVVPCEFCRRKFTNDKALYSHKRYKHRTIVPGRNEI